MATLNWEDIVEISVDDAKQALVNQLQTAGFRATSWQRFSVPLTLVEIGALLWNKGSVVAVFFKNAIYNETATGEALTRLSKSHYDNTREVAEAAERLVTLTCSAAEGPHVIDISDVVVSDDEGTSFRNIEGADVTYPWTLGSGTSKTFLFEAEESGSGGNVPDGTVTTVVTTLAGVTVTDDVLETSGVDAESDTRIQTRNSTKWSDRNELDSTADRAAFVALTAAPAVTLVAIDDNNPRGEGTFDLYIAGPEATAAAEDIATVQDAVDLRIMGANATPKAGLVLAAPEVALDIVGIVYYTSSTSAAALQTAVEGSEDGALVDLVRSCPLGGFDYSPGPANVIPKNDIEAIIKGVSVGGIQPVRTVVLSSPSSDFAVTSFGKVVQGTWNLTYTPVTG